MVNLYADGNYSAAYLVENVVSYPFQWPNNSNVAQFDLEYIQWANTYAPAALGSTSSDAPGSAGLVEQGPVIKIAPGVVRFKRSYCQLPQTWGETQQVAYTFPGLSTGTGSSWQPYGLRQPVTLYAIATVTHTFTSSATAPTLDNTFIVTDGNYVVDYIGTGNPNIGAALTNPISEPATYNVSSDSQLLRGIIWEKVSVVVPKPV
jgi:hypothetical protein